MKYILLPSLIFSVLIIGCNSKNISKEEILINKCIEAHGGLEKWKSLTTTNYTKKIVLYYEDGKIEKELNQKHSYTTSPALSGIIEWSDSINRKIIFQDGIAYKVDGDQKEDPGPSALNTFNSAYYVLNMPWKLLDKGSVISYQGLDTIMDDKIVHTLKVEYLSAEKQDVWEYYLDKEEYFLVGNKVQHGSTYSLITNDEFTMYEGLKFNAKRTSYMVDSLGHVLFVRAKYEYDFI